MDITITGKNIVVTEPLRDYVDKKIGKVEKYFNQLLDAHVTLLVEKLDHIAEVTINGDNVVFHAQVKSADMYASIDNLFEKMEKQIRRYKERVTDKRNKNSSRDQDFSQASFANADREEGFSIRIIETENKPMLPVEAILQLLMNRDRFLLFRQGLQTQETPDEFKRHNYAVAYRRKNGSCSIVENATEGARMHTFELQSDELDPKQIVKTETRDFQVNRFTQEDAAETLQRLNADYYIFENVESRQLNIIYQTNAGDLAVKVPPIS